MIGSCEFLKLLKTWFLWEGTLQEFCGIGKRTWIIILSSTRNVPVPNCKQCEDTKGQWFWCWKAWGQNQGRDYTTLYDMGEWWPWAAGLWIGAWRPIWRRKSARWIACETGNHLGLSCIHSTEPLVFIRWRTKKKSGHVDSTGLVDEFKCV